MRGVRNTDRNVRKFITIADDDLWDMIDRIMTLYQTKATSNRRTAVRQRSLIVMRR